MFQALRRLLCFGKVVLWDPKDGEGCIVRCGVLAAVGGGLGTLASPPPKEKASFFWWWLSWEKGEMAEEEDGRKGFRETGQGAIEGFGEGEAPEGGLATGLDGLANLRFLRSFPSRILVSIFAVAVGGGAIPFWLVRDKRGRLRATRPKLSPLLLLLPFILSHLKAH